MKREHERVVRGRVEVRRRTHAVELRASVDGRAEGAPEGRVVGHALHHGLGLIDGREVLRGELHGDRNVPGALGLGVRRRFPGRLGHEAEGHLRHGAAGEGALHHLGGLEEVAFDHARGHVLERRRAQVQRGDTEPLLLGLADAQVRRGRVREVQEDLVRRDVEVGRREAARAPHAHHDRRRTALGHQRHARPARRVGVARRDAARRGDHAQGGGASEGPEALGHVEHGRPVGRARAERAKAHLDHLAVLGPRRRTAGEPVQPKRVDAVGPRHGDAATEELGAKRVDVPLLDARPHPGLRKGEPGRLGHADDGRRIRRPPVHLAAVDLHVRKPGVVARRGVVAAGHHREAKKERQPAHAAKRPRKAR